MIFNPTHLLVTVTVVVLSPAGAVYAGKTGHEKAKANSEAHAKAAAGPTAEALLALDKQAMEAYLKGNGKFFAGFLSDKFVTREGGARLTKTDSVKLISGGKCEVKEGWRLTEPQLSKVDHDTYVLSYKSNVEGSCTVDGKTEKLPSPVRAATVWARHGEKWRPVFHGENLIVDPQAAPAAGKQGNPPKDDNDSAKTKPASAPAAANSLTEALMAAESSVWEAWKNKDAKKLEELTANEIAFVNIFGAYFANKADTMRDWTGTTCDVTGFTLTDGVATAVSPTVGILTLNGAVTGTCGGMDISGQKIYANSVYVKEGDAWKWAFGFNSP